MCPIEQINFLLINNNEEYMINTTLNVLLLFWLIPVLCRQSLVCMCVSDNLPWWWGIDILQYLLLQCNTVWLKKLLHIAIHFDIMQYAYCNVCCVTVVSIQLLCYKNDWTSGSLGKESGCNLPQFYSESIYGSTLEWIAAVAELSAILDT